MSDRPHSDERGVADKTQTYLAAHEVFARYVLFATIAGLANLGAQEMTIRALPDVPVMLSILVGTGGGFIVKYVLDKRWVFFDDYDSHAAEARKIFVYGLFSVGTTLLFWGVELAAWRVGGTTAAKYAGAVVGLSLGNWIKYLLDKKYVFGRNA